MKNKIIILTLIFSLTSNMVTFSMNVSSLVRTMCTLQKPSLPLLLFTKEASGEISPPIKISNISLQISAQEICSPPPIYKLNPGDAIIYTDISGEKIIVPISRNCCLYTRERVIHSSSNSPATTALLDFTFENK